MYNFTYPAERFDENNIDKTEIIRLVRKHRQFAGRLIMLDKYYRGEHKILNDEKKRGKNPLVCNHAKDISDTASAYFIGNPVTYNTDKDIAFLLEKLADAGADEVDGDNGIDLSIFGLAYEYIYAKEDMAELAIKNLSPINTFMVKDDSIEEKELFSVYYHLRKDDTVESTGKMIATVCTKSYQYVFNLDCTAETAEEMEKREHFFGAVPVVEYLNNKLAIGDFELQIPLIDAYNALMSDRVEDKEQFIDSILALYGALLGDEDTQDEDGKTPMQKLKDERLMELPEGAKAEYLSRTFDEAGVEILRKAIEQDIHKFSHVPCLTDESFGGNVSGVAMEFKLLGLENITKIKTRYYKKGLKKRLRLFANYFSVKGQQIDINGVTPIFTRALPKNLLEISQYVSNLWGKVSKKTLLSQIPFVDNVEEELKAVEEEEQEAAERQKSIFGVQQNEPLEDDME